MSRPRLDLCINGLPDAKFSPMVVETPISGAWANLVSPNNENMQSPINSDFGSLSWPPSRQNSEESDCAALSSSFTFDSSKEAEPTSSSFASDCDVFPSTSAPSLPRCSSIAFNEATDFAKDQQSSPVYTPKSCKKDDDGNNQALELTADDLDVMNGSLLDLKRMSLDAAPSRLLSPPSQPSQSAKGLTIKIPLPSTSTTNAAAGITTAPTPTLHETQQLKENKKMFYKFYQAHAPATISMSIEHYQEMNLLLNEIRQLEPSFFKCACTMCFVNHHPTHDCKNPNKKTYKNKNERLAEPSSACCPITELKKRWTPQIKLPDELQEFIGHGGCEHIYSALKQMLCWLQLRGGCVEKEAGGKKSGASGGSGGSNQRAAASRKQEMTTLEFQKVRKVMLVTGLDVSFWIQW